MGNKNPNISYNLLNSSLTIIEKGQTVRDLGILFDHSLKFQNHIEIICNKAKKISYIILKSLKSNNERFLINMFNTYVRSILEFGSPIWNPHFQKDINKIEKIQNNFLKMIYYRQHPSSTISRDFNNTISYSELLNKYQVMSLEKRRKIQDLKIFNRHIKGYSLISVKNPYLFIPSKTRGDITKLTHKPCSSLIRHNSFFIRNVRAYNKLPENIKKLDIKNLNRTISLIDF